MLGSLTFLLVAFEQNVSDLCGLRVGGSKDFLADRGLLRVSNGAVLLIVRTARSVHGLVAPP